MPRKPRFYLPGIPAHIIQRGNNRQPTFFSEEDYQAFLNWLKDGANRHGCAIHAYVLMTNHVHLLVTPQEKESISRMIQFTGRNYVTYVNQKYGRSGTLWEGRHKGCIITADTYLLACSRYIELNPVRAGMVETPGEYPWSSYRENAHGEVTGIVKQHDLYAALGTSDEARQHAYRELFGNALEADQINAMRSTVQTGTPLGNDRFRDQIEETLGLKVGQAKRGRPRKKNQKGY